MAPRMAEPRTELSRTIRAARIAAGYPTAAAAAAASGIAPPLISELELKYHGREFKRLYDVITRLRLPLEMFFPADLILEAAERLRRARRADRKGGLTP